jgi:hypothetical protein
MFMINKPLIAANLECPRKQSGLSLFRGTERLGEWNGVAVCRCPVEARFRPCSNPKRATAIFAAPEPGWKPALRNLS